MTYFLKNVKQGLERETIRTDKNGRISSTSHPKSLGAPLAHPYITLDFSEAQIEFVTPPLSRASSVEDFAEKLTAWTGKNAGGELLWPLSMPPRMPVHKKIPPAYFGSSADAEQKHIYREGLKRRYGGAVQTISGVHYNFSLSDSFWRKYAKKKHRTGDLSLFKDDSYFALMRNVIRYVPMLTYLLGASPAADKSFFKKPPKILSKMNHLTCFGTHATSLRQSRFGYNNLNNQVFVSFNSLDEYLNDLYRAVTTPSGLWSPIGLTRGNKQVQLNANILQLENEFYSAVRPKRKHRIHPNESAIESLACAGVEYVELRSIDIDPYEPAGIGLPQLYFLHAFMMYCLFAPSPRFREGEQRKWEANQTLAALYGRKPGLKIYSGPEREGFSGWCSRHLGGIAKIAALLDEEYGTRDHSRAVNMQKDKVLHPEQTPSARIVKDIKKSGGSYLQWGLSLAKKYRSGQSLVRLNKSYDEKMREKSRKSLSELARIEARDRWILKGYEHLELSTQVLIRAALKRGINAGVLDDELNVIELSRGGNEKIVKQATITKRDTYLSYELMNDKTLTKIFLERAGLSAPQGGRFRRANEAVDFCREHRRSALVVKPAAANFGMGVSVVLAKSGEKAYIEAVRAAFKHGPAILVEEFIPGKEYRFLVIGGKVVAVLHREPANVVGDGKRTVRELVRAKNADPASFKLPDSYIRLGAAESGVLRESGFSFDSTPPRGRKVYLRKNSNVHTGGDPIAVDDMPVFYKNAAIRAAESVGAKICGADMIIKDFKAKPSKDNYSIIELNWNPAVFMHAYPYKGKPRDVGGAMLDFLGF